MIRLTATLLRLSFVLFSTTLTVVGLVFSFNLPWAADLWPWRYGGLSFLFIGSVFAALGTGGLYVAATRDWHAATGGGITFLIGGAACAIYLSAFAEVGGFSPAFVVVCGGLAVLGAIVVTVCARLAVHDPRRPPLIVVASFWLFTAGLLAAAFLLLGRYPFVFPWRIPADTSSVYGLIFAALAANYAYVAIRGSRSDAVVSLIAFLVYDLVLIGPFAMHFGAVEPDHLVSLVVYMATLTYSGALAVAFLFGVARGRPRPVAGKA